MGHYYDTAGNPHYFVEMTTKAGTRPANITDCKANNWLPGVTEIIKSIDKPGLTAWIIRQSVQAVVTAPDVPGEGLDEKIKRILEDEQQHKEEARNAADLGTRVHEAIINALNGKPFDKGLNIYVQAALPVIRVMGNVAWTEKVLVGEGFAGRGDVLTENDKDIILLDIKTCKTMPTKGSWLEHKLQTSAYSHALGNTADKHVLTANIYLSTTSPGQVAVFMQEDWQDTYERGFVPLLQYWRFANGIS